MHIYLRIILNVVILISIATFGFIFYKNVTLIKGTIQLVIDSIELKIKISKLIVKEPDDILYIPLEEVEIEEIEDTWQVARSEGRTHDGQDIFAKRGTPVYSATYGFIRSVGQNRLGGNVVRVTGAGGRTYYYAHLSGYGPAAFKGNEVSTTSIIGYVGDTGNASGTPPHLHFGVYTPGGPINPYPLLVDRSI